MFDESVFCRVVFFIPSISFVIIIGFFGESESHYKDEGGEVCEEEA